MPADTGTPLPEELDFVLFGRREMTALHGDYCGDATPTDVITFHHGEIVICPDVAQEQGREWERSLPEEVLLYGIHGMLHLLGYDDHSPEDYDRMAKEQERVLNLVLQNTPAP